MKRLWSCFALLALFSACSSRLSVEKRHFRPGYHVQFTKPDKKPALVENTAASSLMKLDSASELATDSIARATHQTQEPFTVPTDGEVVLSSNLPMAVELVTDSLSSESQLALFTESRYYGKSNSSSDSKKLLKELQSTTLKTLSGAPSEDGGKKGLRIAGIVITSVGFLLFLFISWLIGLILMLLGLGLLIAGLSKSGQSSTRSKEKETTWQDVVYLKNGSMIKGIIIEQVPGESIKIQTGDGSVFVYEMSQVVKIAKEPK